jgi:hypothetical protein
MECVQILSVEEQRNEKCDYCSCRLFGETARLAGVCHDCDEQVKKLDETAYRWLMMVIDKRIEEALDKHESRYTHEYTTGYY